MAQKTCAGRQESPLCCEVAWLKRRRELEDMPTAHIDARGSESSPQTYAVEALTCLVEEQNRLLCDILGAVNALTAAQLAAARRER